MKIFLAARRISAKKAGIGNYAYHLIRALARVDPTSHYRVFLGTRWRRTMRDVSGVFPSMPDNVEFSMPKIPSNMFRVGLRAFPGVVGRMVVGRPDVYHETDNIPMQAPSGVRVVNTIHDMCRFIFPEFDPSKTIDLWERHRNTMRDVDRIITDSHHSKRDIVDILKVSEDRVSVIYPGINPIYRTAPREMVSTELKRQGIDGPYILYTGTITPKKNIDQILRAYVHLRGRRADLPQLVLAGSKGWKWEPTFDLIAALNLGSKVTHLGYVSDEDLVALYNGAEAFVYPSLYEGFGFPPLEAMACGCPVIASNVSSIPEVVGGAARLVDPRDDEALAETLDEVLSDSAVRASLREKGAARVKAFSWDTAALQTLAVYREVV